MKIYLDNIIVDDPSDELLKPNFTFRKKDDTGDRAFSFTGDLVFTNKDYTYLYANLVSSPNALENKVVLKFVNDCCSQNQTYEFYITHESLQWCEGSCEITAAAVEKSLSNDQFTCLKNTLIWDDRFGFKNQNHPRMAYCNELRPNWLHDVLMVLVMATWTSFLTIGPVLFVIATIIVVINFIIGINNTIIDAINSLGGSLDHVNPIDIDNDPSTNAYAEFDNWINNLLNSSFGCGRKHPSPLVRDYVNNVCKVCGLTFQSSIFNDPNSVYYNAVYVNAPINKGTTESDNTTYWIEENAPILSGLQFLDQIVIPHNADFDIVNSKLILERRDFFVPKTPFLDITTYNPSAIISVCWSWSRKDRFSYANLRYQKDGVNSVGSEAVARWGDYIEWNPASSYSSLQKGVYEPLMPFSACRFRDDGIDRDVLTFYENLPTVGTILKKYKNAIIMNSHTCYLPMLLIWDGQDRANAACDKFTNINYPGLTGVSANQYYNFPYWFKENAPGNLYDLFHYIENPRVSGYQGFDVTIEIEYDCALLSAIDVDGVVKTQRGNTKGPLQIEIDYNANKLIIKGTV